MLAAAAAACVSTAHCQRIDVGTVSDIARLACTAAASLQGGGPVTGCAAPPVTAGDETTYTTVAMANSHDASAAPPASPPIPAAADPAASAAPAHPIVHRRCHKRECPAAVPCVSRAVACLTNAHVGPSPQRQKPNEEKAEAEAGEGGQHRVSGTYGGTSSASIGGARHSSTERLPNRMVNLVISLGQASVVQ